MKILWLSRHRMTKDQHDGLVNLFGDDVDVRTYVDTVSNVHDVVRIATELNCDVLAVVLPPNILADLVNPKINSKPVIRSIANRVETGNFVTNPATGNEEKEFLFQHVAWEQVCKIEIVTKRLERRGDSVRIRSRTPQTILITLRVVK